MGETLRGGAFVMITNEHDTETGKIQVHLFFETIPILTPICMQILSGSQTSRPDSWWDKTPARSRTSASSRVVQKEYDRQRITSSNPFRIVDEKHSSGLMTRSALLKQRKERGKNVFAGYDLDGGSCGAQTRARADPTLLSNLSFGDRNTDVGNKYMDLDSTERQGRSAPSAPGYMDLTMTRSQRMNQELNARSQKNPGAVS